MIQNERVGALSTLNNQNVLFARRRSDEYHESEVASAETASQHKDATGLVIEMTSTKNTVVENGIVPTLTARMGTGGNQVHAVASFYPQMKAESQCYRDDDISNTLVNGTNPGYQNGIVCYGISSYGSNAMKSDNPHSGIYKTESSRTLNLNGGNPACNQGGVAIVETYQDVTDTVDCGIRKGTGNQLAAQDMSVANGLIVRRLTPTECERLQGFPDGWTDIGEWTDTKGKVHKESSDSARYKALGNSIALPFWFWLLRRISVQYERPATLGSLFDGIGGFPLCWERCNGPGTARWASEIEEFPIAVTKYHFGEK